MGSSRIDASADAAARRGFYALLDAEHRLLERICADLEALADELPGLPAARQLEALIRGLREEAPASRRSLERQTWSLEHAAGSQALPDPCLRALEILQAERAINEAIATELAEVLEDCAEAGAVHAPETLGHLSRQYFLLLRRHMTWEAFVHDALKEKLRDR